jgi:membrane-bound metal-dependent hydrolase YbcI (DUF457 family)
LAAPFGHAFIGMAIARRLGVRSRTGLAAAVVAGNLPDFDIPLSWLIHGDGWKAHRTWTHTATFALSAGALAGLAGLVRAESVEGERDLIADTMMGAAIVGSHLVLDAIPYLPEVPIGPSTGGLRWVNWALDALQWGAVAWLIWPKDGETAEPQRAG